MIKTRVHEMTLQGMPPFLISRILKIRESEIIRIVEEIRTEAARIERNFRVSIIKQK